MTMPFTHKKDEVRATGTLEARTPGDQAVQVLLYVIIALVALACVLPFIYVVAGSFATERELTERPFFLIPQDVSLNAYQYILKQGDVGVPIKALCRQAGISTATYYQWKSKYGGMEASDLRRVKELEAENAKLKRMYAEQALDIAAMKELIAKKL